MSHAPPFSCVLLGEGTLLRQAATILAERGVVVRGIVSGDDGVEATARELGIPLHARDADLVQVLEGAPFDFLFSVVNLTLVPDEVLALPRRGAVNFHDGPLPDYAGLNTPSWGILEGARSWGVTWHEMTTGADRGRVLVERRFPVEPDDTAFTLNARCLSAGIESFPELVDGLAQGTLVPIEQDFSRRRLFTRWQRPKGGGLLDLGAPAAEVTAFVAAHDFGPGFENPFGLPVLAAGREVFYVGRARRADAPPPGTPNGAHNGTHRPPGTVVALLPDGAGAALRVTTADHDVVLSGLRTPSGAPVPREALEGAGLEVGSPVPRGPREALTELTGRALRHEGRWRTQLEVLEPAPLPEALAASARWDVAPGEGGEDLPGGDQLRILRTEGASASHGSPAAEPLELVSAFLAFMARLHGVDTLPVSVWLGGAGEEDAENADALRAFVFPARPMGVEAPPQSPASQVLDGVRTRLVEVRDSPGLLRDFFLRHPALDHLPRNDDGIALAVRVRLDGTQGTDPLPEGVALEVCPGPEPGELSLRRNPGRVADGAFARLVEQAEAFLGAAVALEQGDPRRLADLPLVSAAQRAEALRVGRGPNRPLPGRATLHGLVAEQAARTPDAPALTDRARTLSYAQLEAEAGALALRLVAAGVQPGDRVGIHLDRSSELVLAALGALKAGAAYVPLDPAYPDDRIAFMVEDAGLAAVITRRGLALHLPETPVPRIEVDAEAPLPPSGGGPPSELPADDPERVAYVLYTSGSTGRPKGVMVEHRSVASFFVEMDEVLPDEAAAAGAGGDLRWLAVTSLNFDISVLELFWTLSRGFHVVLHAEGRGGAGAGTNTGGGVGNRMPARTRREHEGLGFGLFYFSSDEEEGLENRYQLLLEGARFADREGFNAIWTPERHFHAFGGLFPNPSVTSAALATITERVELRAGSCVSPLHSPVRIAEEWSVVDNLSRGRVGISFAAGWQPDDFVIRPDAFEDRKAQMFRDIETVKALWRGESLRLPNGEGREVEIRIRPRPFSSELPVWVTAAGNPETFRQAGASGANLLTHLLGQSVEELEEKIALYRAARSEAGHPGRGIVSLMLHTWVGETDDEAREVVREPMKGYLKSAVGLVKAAAWSFPTFRKTTTMSDGSFGIDHLSEEDMDALLDHAFERYYETAGLFGSVESCVGFAARIAEADVDEIPCLIDFGVPTAAVLDSLPRLARVMREVQGAQTGSPRAAAQAAAPSGATAEVDDSVGALLARHEVTHLQCTPSMAALLMADPAARAGLSRLKGMLVGGEALPHPLAGELAGLVEGRVLNVYGPTESTIWSSCHEVSPDDPDVPIGRPFPNTHMVVTDAEGALLPAGSIGELHIGGIGVARGYLGRLELTEDRFRTRPWGEGGVEGRYYRTGDLASFGPDGRLRFHGRIDHQVKVRGYRIELGEIEAVLARHPAVRGAVAMVREDVPGDRRIVGYVLADGSEDAASFREHAALHLPDYMVPAVVVVLDRFPETPNRKIDRRALPKPGPARKRASGSPAPKHTKVMAPPASAPPASGPVLDLVLRAWKELLGRDDVGLGDNFFDLGGHSLLAIELQRRLQLDLGTPVSLVDLFRFPTVTALAGHLAPAPGDDPPGATPGSEAESEMARSSARGADRRAALGLRVAARRERG
jgi:natural product biosynthesis luciferase-like monooxygenase protein